MNFKILQENLSKGLSLTDRFVSSRPQLPILSNILFSVDKGKLKLSATNLDLGINLWLGGVVEKEGQLAVPAHELTEFVSYLPTGEISLQSENKILKVISPKAQATFTGMDPEEFPQIPQGNEKNKLSLNSKDLSQAVSQVGFAAATDEARPILEGIYWQFNKDGYQMVATDGYRLSLKKVALEKSSLKENLSFLIPSRSLNEIVRLINEDQFEVSWDKDQNQIVFVFPNMRISSRLLDGDFPDYENIIPSESQNIANIDKQEFLSAVKIASVFARQAGNVVVLQFQDNKLEIKADATQVGQNSATVPVKYKGEPIKIAFNYRFLLDFLNSISKDEAEIIIKMNNPESPVTFEISNDSSLLHLIMPIRTEE